VALAQAQENMRLVEGRWKVGVGSSLEYSDARYLLTQAQGNLVQALYQQWQAQAELDRSLGGPSLPEQPQGRG
jgi:outer membrane protein TolC